MKMGAAPRSLALLLVETRPEPGLLNPNPGFFFLLFYNTEQLADKKDPARN
jgi:hypothetical protein